MAGQAFPDKKGAGTPDDPQILSPSVFGLPHSPRVCTQRNFGNHGAYSEGLGAESLIFTPTNADRSTLLTIPGKPPISCTVAMKTSFLLFFILSVVTLSVVARLDDHPKFRRAATERKVEDEYIVVTKPGALLGSDLGIPVKRFYSKVLNGFSARLSEPMVEKLRDNEAVEYVEEVPILEVSSVQAVSEWGLDRIDQWYGLNNQYRWDYSGEGVTVYIIDTGIWASHTEFGGRASCAKDFVEEAGGNCRDDNGHGTHVAGIVGGATYGVAKDVQIKSLKVCDANGGCNGDVIIEALEYLASAEGRRVGNLSVSGWMIYVWIHLY
jgi:hypothetical protein